MNIPMSWLRAYADIPADTREFTEDVTMAGQKVEAVEFLGAEISGVVVGRVEEIERHPNADKLLVTRVDVGGGRRLQIVTGAQNLTRGDHVPVAADGAVVHGGKKITSGELRGVPSEGMLCSIDELGSDRNAFPEAPENGIYVFPSPQTLGADALDILELRDDVVEYEITSNRPDCFSVLGIAREAAAYYGVPFKYPEIVVKEEAGGNAADMISVEIRNPELCPRYAARLVKNVRIEPSPRWMRRRLAASGVRPINNIVDITNYVMLEFGQPMHAFDVDDVAGRRIIVRAAQDGESFTTLDGVERKLDGSVLVIADSERAIGIAGVMGGENSKITEAASAVLFESANFNGASIRLTSKRLGLRTDASSKFEKGLDPELALAAVNRAAQLVEELGCGEVVAGVVDCYPNRRTERRVPYQPDDINKFLGTSISAGEMEGLLARLGIQTVAGEAVIPSFRPDLTLQADIAEEIARLYGYEKIAPTLALGTATVGKLTYFQTITERVRGSLVSAGFCEALSYAFESPRVFDKLLLPEASAYRNAVRISNPLGEDFSVMRTQTVNSILANFATNSARRNEAAALFELAKVYIPKSLPLTEPPVEVPVVTFGFYGKRDFYDIKGVAKGLFDELGIEDYDFERSQDGGYPFLHPGRSAVVRINGEIAGFLGEAHPQVLANYEIAQKACAAVFELEKLAEGARLTRKYSPLPKFPGIRRDIALLLRDEIPAAEVARVIRESAAVNLEDVRVFDVYKGEGVEAGCKSAAFSVFFRSRERTLKDEEVSAAMAEILGRLQEKLGAKLRDK